MVLKKACRKTIICEVLEAMKEEKKWKVLIADDIGMRILSSCFTTIELLQENIALIDHLNKKREPLVNFEAIYLVSPLPKATDILISDFQKTKTTYLCAHIFFLYAVPDQIFEKLCKSSCATHIKTVKEINIAFVPYESQAFTLYEFGTLRKVYASSSESSMEYFEVVAEKIATLCCTLEEYPLIRYHRRFPNNILLAERLQNKLEFYAKSYFPSKANGARSQLLIIDRGFDCISPLLHELTLQAMVHDILPIFNDTFQFIRNDAMEEMDEKREIFLDESDDFWALHRHKHIAHVADLLMDIMEKHSDDENDPNMPRTKGDLRRLSKDMSNIIRLRLRRKYSDYRHLVSECIQRFSSEVKKLCDIEQDLAMRLTSDGKSLVDPSKDVLQVLRDEKFSDMDKIRILVLFVLYNNGISEECLQSMIMEGNLTVADKQIINSFGYFGCSVMKSSSAPLIDIVPRKGRENENIFKASRWTPIVKDIMELLLDNELNETEFPYLIQPSKVDTKKNETRSGAWCKDQVSEDFPYLIIFIVGGVTYSEMRCAYEVTNAYSRWRVLIGSDCLLTPETFLSEIGHLSRNLI